ncbi:hypothetical protein [Lysobacter sp. HA18]
MDVRVDGHRQAQAERAQQLQVALPLRQYRIDQHGLPGFRAGDEIGVGRRHRIEQLAEDHRAFLCDVGIVASRPGLAGTMWRPHER